jgi:ribonuclease HI
MNNRKANATCGSRTWFGHSDPNNKALHVPDSKYVIKGLTTLLEDWENRGWIEIKNTLFFKKAITLLCQRTITISLPWTKVHSRVEGNKENDCLAKEGVLKPCKDRGTAAHPNMQQHHRHPKTVH